MPPRDYHQQYRRSTITYDVPGTPGWLVAACWGEARKKVPYGDRYTHLNTNVHFVRVSSNLTPNILCRSSVGRCLKANASISNWFREPIATHGNP